MTFTEIIQEWINSERPTQYEICKQSHLNYIMRINIDSVVENGFVGAIYDSHIIIYYPDGVGERIEAYDPELFNKLRNKLL